MQGTYAVIGDPIDHSLSPAAHNAAFRELGMDCSYIAYRVPRGELREGLESLAAARIAGFNVTIPHKVAIMALLDSADGECAAAGACNTVRVDGGRLEGHNTDVDGFMEPLRSRGAAVRGAGALVLGAGGAARAAAVGLARDGARTVTVAARSPDRARDVARMASSAGAASRAVEMRGAAEAAASADIVVNATPLGMRGEACQLPAGSIRADSVVYEVVYRPMRTALVECALARGATVVYGHEMLLAQAALSFEIWHGARAPRAAMRRAILGAGAP
ncbi:MAG: shikimate dehydrogenase [Thaumarchaeota archaeon]|nr:shikimate dehydrogenase [Nitrososphaerota archaeon]MDD9842565.1 shikimate dehydrogenase [Nitrososphaerota archaeon]